VNRDNSFSDDQDQSEDDEYENEATAKEREDLELAKQLSRQEAGLPDPQLSAQEKQMMMMDTKGFQAFMKSTEL